MDKSQDSILSDGKEMDVSEDVYFWCLCDPSAHFARNQSKVL